MKTQRNSTPSSRPSYNESKVSITKTDQKAGTTINLSGDSPTDVFTNVFSSHLTDLAKNIDRIIETHDDTFPAMSVAKELDDVVDDLDRGRVCMLGSVLSSWSSDGTFKKQKTAANFISKLGSNVYTDIEDVCAVAQLLIPDDPIIFNITNEFKKQRADQRRDICKFISALSCGVDVYLHPESTLIERWLIQTHTPHLPSSLREQCNVAHHQGDEKKHKINDALDNLNVDGGRVATLRYIGETPSEKRTLDELESKFDVNRDTIHNRLHHLRNYSLISETMETNDGKAVFLTSTGRGLLSEVYESTGVQTTLEEELIGTGKSVDNVPCNPAESREGDGWNRNRLPDLHEIYELPQHRYHALTSMSNDADITVGDTAAERSDDRAAPSLFIDHSDRRVAVSAEYDNPMQYWVCIARALANADVWDAFLTDDKLDHPDGEKLVGLFHDHKTMLRQLRCLGYTPDHITTLDGYREHIIDGLEEILELTKRLTYCDYPSQQSRSEFRATITAKSQGLAGTMAHILDLCGVDLVREMRIPRFREFDEMKREGLCNTIGYAATIQSEINEGTTYRQVYEDRETKLEQRIEVNPQKSNPFSSLIGSFVVVGDFMDHKPTFVEQLENRLSPKSPHEDAVECNLRVDVKGDIGRSEYATTVTRILAEKNIKPSPEAVSTIAGVVNSPFEAASALHYLQPNDDTRTIDSREVRYALAQLCPGDILRQTAATKQRVVMALLEASAPLNRSDLADAADVTTRSLRNHLDELVELGLVRDTQFGYRFELSFGNTEEQTTDRYPAYVADPSLPTIHKAAKAIKLGLTHHFNQCVSDKEYPTWSGRRACLDTRILSNPVVWLYDILPLLWSIGCRETYRQDDELGQLVGSEGVDVQIGPELDQKRIQSFTG